LHKVQKIVILFLANKDAILATEDVKIMKRVIVAAAGVFILALSASASWHDGLDAQGNKLVRDSASGQIFVQCLNGGLGDFLQFDLDYQLGHWKINETSEDPDWTNREHLTVVENLLFVSHTGAPNLKYSFTREVRWRDGEEVLRDRDFSITCLNNSNGR
jgi:hypothetical protein